MKVRLNGYAKRRSAEYPPMEEQLDALWHAMDQGVLPKVPGFFDKVQQIKERHPKGGPPGKA